MPRYIFKARGDGEHIQTGDLTAVDANAVAKALKLDGLTPVEINLAKPKLSTIIKRIGNFHLTTISDADRLMFCRQMSSILQTGMSASASLECIAKNTKRTLLKQMLTKLAQDVSSGQELASALRQQPKLLSPLAVAMIHAGEQVGKLDSAFNDICEELEREQTTKRDVWHSLRYPLVVSVALLAALAVVNIFAVPAFTKIFIQLDTELPWATRLLIGTSDFIHNYGALLGILLLSIGLGSNLFARTRYGKVHWHHLKMSTPLISKIFNYCMLSRFCRSLSMMLTTGIPLFKGLIISAEVTNNSYFSKRMHILHKHLKSGATFEQAAQETGLFTPMVLQMLAVGEASGDLPALLGRLGDYYETEARHQARQLSSLIQPALLLMLAIVVIIFALGIYLPMWSMMEGYL